MAHEIEIKNGVASAFMVGTPSWHRNEHLLDVAPTFDEAEKLAGHDYEVVKAPTYLGHDEHGVLIPSELAFVTKRTDTGKELGAVGRDYQPVQNAVAFGILRPLVDSGVLLLETGGTLRDGADAWLLGKWNVERFGPVVKEVFADEVIPYSTVMANHSGRRATLIGNTPIRVVCANTLAMAEVDGLSRWESIRHTGDAEGRLVEAAEKMFGGIIERYEVIAKQYRLLKQRALTSEEFSQHVLDVIAPRPQDNPRWNPEAKRAEMVLERAEKKRDLLTTLWTGGKGHTGDASAWEAYNGAVEALDHDEAGLFPVRGGVYRAAALLDGTYGTLKNRVLDRLVTLASA